MAYSMHLQQKLLVQQCEKKQALNPVEHVMPHFDGLACLWAADPEQMGNAHLRDRFHFWCDLDSRETFAMYWSEGFFSNGSSVFAGGMQISSDAFVPAEDAPEEVDGIHIAGYCWEPDGITHLLTNREDNEAWCDLDDWIFEAFFFSDFMPDGSLIPPCPPGYARSWEQDADGNNVPGCRPLPKLMEVDKELLQMGFTRPRRPGDEIEQLEKMLGEE